MADKRWTELVAEVGDHDRTVEEAGGAANVSRQKRMGRMTARERIAALVDDGSFVELGRHVLHRHAASSERLAENRVPGDGVVCGFGNVAGRAIAVYAHDPTTLRGALGHEASRKIRRLLDLAWEKKLPVVCFADCDGVRVDEGIDAIEAYGEILRQTVRQETGTLQMTLVCGLCVGAAAYAAALNDLVGMVAEQSMMFITGPKVTKAVTGEETTLEDLGGAEVHATKTGQCHAVVNDEREGIAWMKSVLAMLDVERPTADPTDRDTRAIESIVPTAPRRAYDVTKLLDLVFDEKSIVELSASFARNLVTAFARLGGRTVAIVASQPMVLAGCLDVDASRKGAQFVRLASKLGIPVVTFVDVPGFLPGTKQEHGGILREGADLLSAYGAARVPLVCVVVRKSYGGASVLSFAADTRLALPSARIGPVGADLTAELVDGATAIDDSVWAAASAGYVDRVLRPEHVRRELFASVRALVGTKLVR